MDNVFVMALIFSYLAIPRQYPAQGAVLGIMGVIVAAARDDWLGAALIT